MHWSERNFGAGRGPARSRRPLAGRWARLAAVLALALAWALTQPPSPARAGDGEPLGVRAAVHGAFTGGADVGDGDGQVAVRTAGVSLGCPVATLSYALTSYDWDDVARLPFGNGSDDPWDELHLLHLAADGHGMLDAHWGWFAGGAVGAGWEEELDGSGFLALSGGALYVVDEDLSLRLGLAARLHRVGLRLLPAVGLDWRTADAPGFSASVGAPESWLRWRFDPAWAMRLGAFIDGGIWRLKDGSPVADGGYVDNFGIVAALVADWSPLPGLTLSFGPDYHFARSLTVYDDDGDRRDDYDVDPAPGGSAALRWTF